MRYPARFKPDPTGGFVVSFRDIPEAITQGETLEEAYEMALDALITALDFYFEDQREVPLPSSPKRGEKIVVFPATSLQGPQPGGEKRQRMRSDIVGKDRIFSINRNHPATP